MRKLLFVSHAPSINTRQLRDVAVKAIAQYDVALDCRESLEADVESVLACDGILIGTTENFGSIAGLTKDFFERIYYPCLEKTEGLPFAVYVRAGQDGAGSLLAIDRITTGLRWRSVQSPLLLQGEFDESFFAQVTVLAETFAAGLDLGLF
ncbi:MAG: flavodoxin family protein [Pseudomonadota bacterium]